MTKFIVAYRNNKVQWTRITDYRFLNEAEHCASLIVGDFQNSAIGIFVSRENETIDWRERKPHRINNEHVLVTDESIAHAFGGLVNSLPSTWL